MKNHTSTIRDLLALHPNGLTTSEVVLRTGIKYTTAYNAMNRNRVFVIDRWVPSAEVMRWVPVWCLVEEPKHAPMPTISVQDYLLTHERRAA